VRCLELNTSIALLDNLTDKLDIVHQLNELNHKLMGSVAASMIQPIAERLCCRETMAEQFMKNL
jgi:hypothetical protein